MENFIYNGQEWDPVQEWDAHCEANLNSEMDTIRDASEGHKFDFIRTCMELIEAADVLCFSYGLPEGDYEALYNELH